MAVTASQVLEKQPGESLVYRMNFVNLLSAGEAISTVASITAIPSGELTIGAGAISGSSAIFRVSGGVDGSEYRIAVQITTSTGNTREADGILKVSAS